MGTPPKLPDLAPSDKQWFRWATAKIASHDTEISKNSARVTASNIQRSAVAGQGSSTGSKLDELAPILPTLPVGPPQIPTAPQLTTDHATVTIRWDGQVLTGSATTNPGAGFAHVIAERLDPQDPAGVWTTVGNAMGISGVMVDVNVIVGNTYIYRMVTTDVLGVRSTPSDSASIVVSGVDLGSLNSDLQQTLTDLQTSATTGGLIQYSTAAPTDPKYHAPNSIWFDTSDPNGAVPKRWDANTNTWVAVPYGTGALGPGSVVASDILAGAIDTYHLGASIVTADKIGAGAITTEKLGANAVVANTIAAGSIDANKLAVGAVDAKSLSVTAYPPQAAPSNRVIRPLTDSAYWGDVIAGIIVTKGNGTGNVTNGASATTGGISLTPNTSQAYLYVTARVPVPASRKVHISGASSAVVQSQVRYFVGEADQNGTLSAQSNDLTADGVIVQIPDGATYYSVKVKTEVGAVATVVNSMSVFEVISTAPSAQRSELSPSGLRLYSDSGELAVDLSTSSTNFVSIYNDGQAQATIDEAGGGSFQTLSANEVTVNGNDLVAGFDSFQRMDGGLDGGLLNRLPRGVIYAANWASMENMTVNTQYQRIATGSFNVPADRQYMLFTDLGGLQVDNASGVNIYVELQLSMTPMNNVSDGTVFQRAVVYNGKSGYWALPPITFRARDWQIDFGVDPTNNIIPANADIYWQINTNLSAAPTSSYVLHQFSSSTGMTLLDVGPVIKPLIATDHTTSGAPATGGAGTGTGGTSTSKTVTQTWNASWSASWNQGGSGKVNGTGTYTDANMLYEGLGASAMGSKFGFPSVTGTLSGKTINKVEVYLQNRWTYANAGGTAHLAGHNNTIDGSTFGSTVSGTGFTQNFGRGQGKWFTIPDSQIPYSSWKSGAVKGLALTVQGSDAAYQYYDGVGKSNPPKLRITYTT